MTPLTSLAYPPLDGSVVLPQVLDFNLRYNPSLPFFLYSNEGSNEVTQISHLEFIRACHRVAHALRPGRTGPEGQVVALIANADTLLYQTINMGLILAGLIPFPISPRNSPAAVINMLQKVSCHHIVATRSSLRPLLDGIESGLASAAEAFHISISEVPSLQTVYPKLSAESETDPFDPYPSPETFPQPSDVVLYLHSSGSTGFPKPIPQTHLIFAQWCSLSAVPVFRTHDPPLRFAVMALPGFHMMGIFGQLFAPLFSLRGVIIFPPSISDAQVQPIIPTSENILDHARRSQANSLLTVPAFLEMWAQSQEAIDYLKTMVFVQFGGGPLTRKKGDALFQAGVKIHPVYGATEFGPPTILEVSDDGWEWLRFSPETNPRWMPQDDNKYELHLLTCETHHVSVENLPDVKGYATSDLFEKHPTKEGLWRVVGRLDDVLILASGEKTVPAPMENIIMASPFVGATIMFGRERNQVGILIEPRRGHEIDVTDHQQLAEFRNAIWPVVEQANESAPAFSRIFKEMILVTHSDKPMLRAPKGTVMRKATLKEYDAEIEALYETVEDSTKAAEAVEPPKSWTNVDLEVWLTHNAADIQSSGSIAVDVDLFAQGFDSLSATFLRNRIIGALRSSTAPTAQKAIGGVVQNIVFANPTIKQLAQHVADLVSHPENASPLEGATGKERIEGMIEKYSTGLSGFSADAPVDVDAVVLLTGSTGGLGSYLLAKLLEHNNVKRVYAFNRPSSARLEDRQKAAFEDRGLDTALLKSPKLVYVEGEATSENLGLESKLYQELLESTTVIIHNAWRLDFNLSLSSFEPHIRGTRNLIDFALSSSHSSSLRFMFTSSIASAQSWDQTKGGFPEEVQTDVSYSVGGGYGEGKYVAERLLAKSGLQGSSIRIGQVSGGQPNGAWATTDWVPILVKSSIEIGALPDAEGLVSWIPMHVVSQVILEIALADAPPPIAFNVVHPTPVAWRLLMAAVGEGLVKEKSVNIQSLPLVPFKEWFFKLEGHSKNATEDILKRIPAIKLLEFFRGMSHADAMIRESGRKDLESGGVTKFLTEKSQAASPTMRGLEKVGPDDAHLWVKYWMAKEFIG